MTDKPMSGLEMLRAIINGELPHPSIAATIPMVFVEADAGRVLFEARAGERHLNPLGGVHGGFIATVLDSVTGCAVHSMLEAGVDYATIDLNVKMLRPVPRDSRLIAEAKVINISKSLGVSEGTLKDENGKLLAHATCSCLIKRPL
ncbi:MAG: hypothetical protein ACI9LO_002685 [Planctomycetota bacterium]|jgi:uncharacterized protein (TIGR00369 family)